MFHTKMGTTNDPGVILLKYPDTASVILYSRKKYKKFSNNQLLIVVEMYWHMTADEF